MCRGCIIFHFVFYFCHSLWTIFVPNITSSGSLEMGYVCFLQGALTKESTKIGASHTYVWENLFTGGLDFIQVVFQVVEKQYYQAM